MHIYKSLTMLSRKGYVYVHYFTQYLSKVSKVYLFLFSLGKC